MPQRDRAFLLIANILSMVSDVQEALIDCSEEHLDTAIPALSNAADQLLEIVNSKTTL